MRILVLGIGNTLLTDEGAGVHVVRTLQSRPPARFPKVEFLDGGTLSFTLAVPIQEADALIVVDAAQLGAAPGTTRVFEGAEMDRFVLGARKSSAHEVGLADLMTIASLNDHWPVRRALVAIQPAKLDWGEEPTPAVADGVREASRQIETLIGAWRHAA
jgi:hydrogenase maturation protease